MSRQFEFNGKWNYGQMEFEMFCLHRLDISMNFYVVFIGSIFLNNFQTYNMNLVKLNVTDTNANTDNFIFVWNLLDNL